MRVLWLSSGFAALSSVISTWAVERSLTDPIVLIDPWMQLHLSFNDGIAFGINLPEMIQSPLIVLALIVIALYAARTACSDTEELAFGLVIGGGIGNIIDRLQDKLVTDFIQVGSFPVFNIADSCITVGVGILLLGMIIDWESVERGIQ